MEIKPCKKCGRETKGRFSELKKEIIFHCAACQIKALASFIEEANPDDTLKDISDSEQTGAWLRSMVK